MRLIINTTGTSFMVSKAPEAKEYKGEQQKDPNGLLKWTTELVAVSEAENEGADVIRVVTSGDKPKLTKGSAVSIDQLEAVPYTNRQTNSHAVAFRADNIKPKK